MSILLAYQDSWETQSTKEVIPGLFSSVFQVVHEETSALEVLRDLDAQRRTACVVAGSRAVVSEEQVGGLEHYVTEVAVLASKLDDKVLASFSTSWTSPMAGRAAAYFKTTGLVFELGMAGFLLAASLRALALSQLASASRASSVEAGGTAASATLPRTTSDVGGLVEAVTSSRRAAGVHEWLAVWALPRIAAKLPAERPAELLISMSQVMVQVCLAEAQSVTAHRAGQRGSPAGLVAGLWVGAWELWENAAKTLKENTGDFNTVSDRLRRFLAISGALARARALRWLAEDCLVAKHQAGQGEAACLDAASILATAGHAAEGDASWKAVISQEVGEVEAVRAKCEKDRTSVYFQTIAKSAPDLPASKILVKPLPFTPLQPETDLSSPGAGAGSGEGAGAASEQGTPGKSGSRSVSKQGSSAAAAASALVGLTLDKGLSLRRTTK